LDRDSGASHNGRLVKPRTDRPDGTEETLIAMVWMDSEGQGDQQFRVQCPDDCARGAQSQCYLMR